MITLSHWRCLTGPERGLEGEGREADGVLVVSSPQEELIQMASAIM
jgi:hypothetical protein